MALFQTVVRVHDVRTVGRSHSAAPQNLATDMTSATRSTATTAASARGASGDVKAEGSVGVDGRAQLMRHDDQMTNEQVDRPLCSAVHVSGSRCELDQGHQDVHRARTEHTAEPLVWTTTPCL